MLPTVRTDRPLTRQIIRTGTSNAIDDTFKHHRNFLIGRATHRSLMTLGRAVAQNCFSTKVPENHYTQTSAQILYMTPTSSLEQSKQEHLSRNPCRQQ